MYFYVDFVINLVWIWILLSFIIHFVI